MKLYSWGANSFGQLGHNIESEKIIIPKEINIYDAQLEPENIVQISGGARHSLILDKNGSLYSSGSNTFGQLGISENSSTFVKIPNTIHLKFVHISCGWDFSAAVTDTNELYVWGSNKFNQLGITSENLSKVNWPFDITLIKTVTVACGLRHMLVLGLDGHLYTCGSNVNGQLGINYEYNKKSTRNHDIQQIPHLENIIAIATGQKHSLAMDKTGCMYGWGDNKWGQLGINPETVPKCITPMKIGTFHPNSKIFAGWTHTVVIDENMEIWNWGRNDYGQLGRTEVHENWKPKKLDIGPVKYFAIGSEYNMVVTQDNQLLSWGWNEHGICGNGTEINQLQPSLVGIDTVNGIKTIGCGTGQSFAVVY